MKSKGRAGIRLTGGVLGGRRILVPKTAVRPAQDRVRAAVFSSLAGRVEGARVLDMFAGSGAMGLEAFSRGALFVCWVEADREASKTLERNVEMLCGDPGTARVVRDDAIGFLCRQERIARVCREKGGRFEPFDIIFADPPYDRDGGWLKRILHALSGTSMLRIDGLLVMEQDAEAPVAVPGAWALERNRAYGRTRMCFFRKMVNERVPI